MKVRDYLAKRRARKTFEDLWSLDAKSGFSAASLTAGEVAALNVDVENTDTMAYSLCATSTCGPVLSYYGKSVWSSQQQMLKPGEKLTPSITAEVAFVNGTAYPSHTSEQVTVELRASPCAPAVAEQTDTNYHGFRLQR